MTIPTTQSRLPSGVTLQPNLIWSQVSSSHASNAKCLSTVAEPWMAAAAYLTMWLVMSIIPAQSRLKDGILNSLTTKQWWDRWNLSLNQETALANRKTNKCTPFWKCKKQLIGNWTTRPRLCTSRLVELWLGFQETKLDNTTTWLVHHAKKKLLKRRTATDAKTARSLSLRLCQHLTSLLGSATSQEIFSLTVLGRPEIRSWTCLPRTSIRFLTLARMKSRTSASPASSRHSLYW